MGNSSSAVVGVFVGRVNWSLTLREEHRLQVFDCYSFGYEQRVMSVDKKTQLDVTFVFFISLLIVAQHVSDNHVPIIRS